MYNIIIPTYNEIENVGVFLYVLQDVMQKIGEQFKIIIVDDGSPDGTHDYVVSLNLPNVTIVSRERKLGLGSAYRDALSHCKFPFTIVMDADLSHDPAYIEDMINVQKEDADIVVGTRYSGNGGVHGWPFMRKVTSLCANNLAKMLLNIKISDVTGSYRLYKTNVFEFLVHKSKSVGYSFQMELLYIALRYNFVISECPIVFHDRKRGCSKLSIVEIVLYLKTVVLLLLYV